MSGGNYVWYSYLGYKKGDQIYDVMTTDSAFQNRQYRHLRDYDVRRELQFTREVFYRLHDKTYFYKTHNPIVYEITSEGEKAVYQLVFGHHPFPSADYLNALSDGVELMKTGYVATYHLLETSSCILARYLVGEDRRIGIYNKKTNKTYRYADFHSDKAILNGAGFAGITDDDRFILSLQAEPLKRRYIESETLRELAKTVSEEDNPILCIVAFK